MRSSDIPKISNGDLITEYVFAFSDLVFNMNRGRGTKVLTAQCTKIEDELLKRGLISEENLKRLRG